VKYVPWFVDEDLITELQGQDQAVADGSGTAVATSTSGGATVVQATASGGTGTVSVGQFQEQPIGVPAIATSTGKFVDVSVALGSTFTAVEAKFCDLADGTALRWWDPVTTNWRPVVGNPQTGPDAAGCLTETFTATGSSPTIAQLTGTVFAAVKRVTTPPSDGGVGGVGGDSGSTTPPTDSTSRIAGSNRYATAALIAGQFVKADAAYTGAVVLANGENFKQGLDALSANYLAGAQHAPILLTQAGPLPAATVAGLRAVLAGQAGATIYVMGQSDSVSDTAVAQATKIAEETTGGTVIVKRVAGADRYATSAASATSSGAVGTATIGSGAEAKTAILASGDVNADALAAGSLSYAAHLPVLLTQAGSLPQPVQDAITKLGVKQVIVLGGTDRVSAAVVKALAAIGVTSVTRIAGTDRFDTAARIYRFARSNPGVGMSGSTVYLANGITGFPDALAVGPLAGATGSSVLTVSGTSLPTSTKKFITTYKSAVTSVTPLGADATVAQSVVDAAKALLG
jgi:putative cell wall-binding protein